MGEENTAANTKPSVNQNLMQILTSKYLPIGLSITSILGFAGSMVYNSYQWNRFEESISEIFLDISKKELELSQLTKLRLNQYNNKIQELENIVGVPLGYSVYLDINGDSILDKITPYSSGFYIVEIGDGNGKYGQSYDVDTRRDMAKLITNYFFKDMALDLNSEQIESIFQKNPEVICGLTKLALDYKFWTEKNDLQFKKIYDYRTQKYTCPIQILTNEK